MPTPFTPENVIRGLDGRWYHDGEDVTDRPVWWRCKKDPDHEPWEASIGQRTSGNDVGCPSCWSTALNGVEQTTKKRCDCPPSSGPCPEHDPVGYQEWADEGMATAADPDPDYGRDLDDD